MKAKKVEARKYWIRASTPYLLLLVPIFSQALLSFVRRNLMTFSFLSARHNVLIKSDE
ncbi:hypothetical protein ACFFSP_16575 [Persicitalea jodogahamensis]|uniref:hypothetical protein n=1 Tax=Persicitalea jodogahamensis TaxID=402147 RepID=UPI001E350C7A|nr:hypothetical protein [Persicitalea jodogahamensis]